MKKLFPLSMAALLLCTAQSTYALDISGVDKDIHTYLDANYQQLDTLYKDIHQHPELGFQEVRTAKVLADQMRTLGFQVTEKVGGTGVVAIYKNGDGPVIMVRTELDALPMEEKSGLPYASHAKQTDLTGKETYVAHSCGHDIHMATWVGTASALVKMKTKWHGTLLFVAQPAEERITGASAMIKDGIFDRFGKPDYAFALHTSPTEYGKVSFKPGVQTSNGDSFSITFKGEGGHGSMPEKTIDPVVIGARFVTDVQSVVSREISPNKFGVITVGAFNAGSSGNIIPDEAKIQGTIRSYDNNVRSTLIDGVTRIANASSAASRAPKPVISIGESKVDSVINDSNLAASTGAVFKAKFGANFIEADEPASASEDFSAFVNQGIPSLYFNIGVYSPEQIAKWKNEGAEIPSNHSPFFAPVPEPTIRTGVEAMTLAVMNAMGS
ncbi:amidohydrolase [Pectobacterium fontis]|uniref:Peptidase M20 n=1 Tax=Pectobacterium fontis TaxID=2558042 RepID=A0A7V8L5I6_9GAMM|nr:amidohydrolase [Pectobacterium fontis]KHN52202.1 peptidase M20 [Pectobacterium fontis]